MTIRSYLYTGLLVSLSLSAQPSAESDVRALVARYLDARNHADEAKTRALFTEDADQLVSTGEWRRGRDNLVKGAMASSRKELGTSRIQIDGIRFLTDNVAIADGDYETMSAAAGSPPRKMRTTFVLKREAGDWKIAAIRNMLPSK